jgi:hypothetical protein
MISVRRRHTAGRGREVILSVSEDVYEALKAAVQVAYDDPEATPPEYAEPAAELWGIP